MANLRDTDYRRGAPLSPEQVKEALALGANDPQWLTDARGLQYSLNPDGSKRFNAPTFAEQKQSRPGDSFFRNTVWDDKTGTWGKKTNWGNIIGLAAMVPSGIAAGQALAGAGATGATTGATGATGATTGAGTTAAGTTAGATTAGTTASAGTTAAKVGMGTKALGFLGKLKDAGIDPTRLGLGALSLLGGPDQQFRQSYGGKGRVDPYAALQGRSDQINSLISQLQSAPKFEQRAAPAPITIPGIPFQIGGGLNGPLAGLEPNPDQKRQFVG